MEPMDRFTVLVLKTSAGAGLGGQFMFTAACINSCELCSESVILVCVEIIEAITPSVG